MTFSILGGKNMLGWLFGSSHNDEDDEVYGKGKKSKDRGLFGIDWDGDGKVSDEDDFLTMDMFDDDDFDD